MDRLTDVNLTERDQISTIWISLEMKNSNGATSLVRKPCFFAVFFFVIVNNSSMPEARQMDDR